MIRKIALGLAILISGFSFNQVLASWGQSPCYVTVPCFEKGFTIGLTGFYSRPQNDDLTYAVVYPATDENLTNLDFLKDGHVKSISPDYDWGYRISLGYNFSCTANDLLITYRNFNHHTQENVNYRDAIVFATLVDFQATTISDNVRVATHAGATFDYQALDVDFGQHFNIGCNTHVKLFAGVRFADLERKFDVDYLLDVIAIERHISVHPKQDSRFRGVGPRAGTEIQYSLCRGFGLIGEATGSLLVGDIRSSYFQRNLNTLADVTVVDDFRSFRNPDQHKCVPNLTGKLGVNYNYDFCNCSHTRLTLEAGYQVDHYFDVVYNSFAVNAFDGNKQVSDVTFNGPYVSVQVKV